MSPFKPIDFDTTEEKSKATQALSTRFQSLADKTNGDYAGVSQDELLKVAKDTLGASVLVKIGNAAKRNGFPVGYYLLETLKSPVFAASVFSKDPGKQGFHQKRSLKTIGGWLEESDAKSETCGVMAKDSVIVLQSKGSGAKYLSAGGGVLSQDEFYAAKKKDAANDGKSIDLHFCYKHQDAPFGLSFFASMKHTNDEGGGQDNQCVDVCNFIQKAKNNSNVKNVLFAVVDGPYYEKASNDPSNKTATRMDELNDMGKGKCRVLRSHEVPKFVSEQISKYLSSNGISPDGLLAARLAWMRS